MAWLIDNWSLLLVILSCLVVAFVYIKKFKNLPSEQQVTTIKEWLLWAVIEAEKEFKGGTGALKLRYVYNLFLERFPSLSSIIPFELFSLWVDEVLVQMKHLLETNEAVAKFVDLDSKGE